MSDPKPLATVEEHLVELFATSQLRPPYSDNVVEFQRARDRAIAEAAWKLSAKWERIGDTLNESEAVMQRDLDALLDDGEGTG